VEQVADFPFTWIHVAFAGLLLVALNILDLGLTLYALPLGFVELNPLVSLGAMMLVLKLGSSLIPILATYLLHRFKIEGLLWMPLFVIMTLISFYCAILILNVRALVA
jgi:hypothetical protein